MENKSIRKYYSHILIALALLLIIPSVLNVFHIIPHHYMVNQSLHTSVEAIGGIISLLIAILIYKRFSQNQTELDYPFIALGFLAMGVFDLIHSVQLPGNVFVFTHFVSILFGAVWFGALALPREIRYQIKKPFVFLIIGFIWLLIIAWVIFLPEYLPVMLVNGEFTLYTFLVNHFSGAAFLLAVIFLIRRFLKTNETEIYLIALVALIQGLTRFTFHQSEMWDIDWWIWHFARLGGTVIIIYAVLKIFENAYNELENANLNQQNILNAMPFGVMVIGRDKRVRHINHSAAQLTGYSQNEVVGELCYNTMCVADCDNCPIIDRNESVFGEMKPIGRKDGSVFTSIKSVIPIEYNGENVLLEGFVDMTETVNSRKDLELSEKKFRDIFDAVSHAIFILDFESGGIVDVNQTAIKQYGYTKEEFLKITPFDFIHPDFHKEFDRFVFDLKSKGSFHGYTVEVRKDGSQFYSDVSGTIVTFNNKPHLLGAVKDISELKGIEQQLRETLADLEQKNKDLQQFAYVSSHDLQEPLRKIKNYTDLLELQFPDDLNEKAKHFLNVISNGAMRMQILIEDLLSYSRISTQGGDLLPTKMSGVVYKVKKSMKEEIEKVGAEIIYDKLPEVVADEVQMIQLLRQVIGNAIKFRSEVKPVIQIASKEENGHWQISVKDNGIGLEQQFDERIFVVFQRLHNRDKYEGTGIGLALCKKIIERHKGEIWVESEPEKGATFFFTIPK